MTAALIQVFCNRRFINTFDSWQLWTVNLSSTTKHTLRNTRLRLVLIGEEFENAANLDARRSRGESFGNDNDIALDGYSDDGPNYSDEEEQG